MNSDIFIVEEENLICMYNTESRAALMDDIRAAMPDFDEPEIREIAESVLEKLDAITDAEFSALTFSPAYDGDETEV